MTSLHPDNTAATCGAQHRRFQYSDLSPSEVETGVVGPVEMMADSLQGGASFTSYVVQGELIKPANWRN